MQRTFKQNQHIQQQNLVLLHNRQLVKLALRQRFPPHVAELCLQLQAQLQQYPEVLAAYLFGSHARGQATANSDVDLGLLYDVTPPARLDAPDRRLCVALSQTLGAEVDVVVLNNAPVTLVHRVLRDGIRLIDRNHSATIAFETRMRALYLDLLPLLRFYRRRALRATSSSS